MSTEVNAELVKRLEEDSSFFDQLVELVPPKVYFGPQHQPGAWKFLHSSSAKAVAKQEAKDNHKKARRLRLDPSAAKTTLDIQKEQHQQELEKAAAQDQSGTGETAGEGEQRPAANGSLPDSSQTVPHPSDRAATYAQLRERLEQRLATLRQQRHAEDGAVRAKKARDWQRQKRARAAPASGKAKGSGPAPSGSETAAAKKLPSPAGEVVKASTGPGPPPRPEPELQLQFGRIQTGQGGALQKKPRKRQKTAQLLAKAAALQEQLSAASQTEEGKQQVAKHVWSAAADRAAGQKVLDDPKLLKRTLQRQKKARQKSTEQWESRKGHQQAGMAARQQKRKDQLQQRADTKKKNKIAKREKKLLRPGFEGRAGAVINKPTANTD